MNRLAADIGGTYSRFAVCADGDTPASEPLILRNAEFASLDAALTKALATLGWHGGGIAHLVLALPGPVEQDPVVLTNIDWRIERAALRRRFAIDRLTVVNDFQAAAIGALRAPAEQRRILNPGATDDGPCVVAGAGTGLGMAWFCQADSYTLPAATEGGHLDFAPGNERELALFRHLAARHGHVSYERILSGAGLVETFRFLANVDDDTLRPADIAARASGGDPLAVAAVRAFVGVFAAYAGNLALAFNPGGGIYLCGGLTIHLADWFEPTAFATRFADKGRMAEMVRRIPVYLVARHDVGLAGALDIAEKHNRAET